MAVPPVRIDRTLLRAVVQARRWGAMLEDGRIANIEALAAQESLCVRRTTKVLPLAYLAPDLVEMILAGKQPASLPLAKLLDEKLPYLWGDQRALFARFN